MDVTKYVDEIRAEADPVKRDHVIDRIAAEAGTDRGTARRWLRSPPIDGALESLWRWCQEQMVESQHGHGLEDAGRASAYARVMVQVRSMQRRGT